MPCRCSLGFVVFPRRFLPIFTVFLDLYTAFRVKFATNVETGARVAIKILDKEKIQKQNMGAQIKKEVRVFPAFSRDFPAMFAFLCGFAWVGAWFAPP
jgi:hypothetical protein